MELYPPCAVERTMKVQEMILRAMSGRRRRVTSCTRRWRDTRRTGSIGPRWDGCWSGWTSS